MSQDSSCVHPALIRLYQIKLERWVRQGCFIPYLRLKYMEYTLQAHLHLVDVHMPKSHTTKSI